MDELLKALAEAVRTGSQLALPALLGYYFIKLVEYLMFPISFWVIGKALYGMIAVAGDKDILRKQHETENIKAHIELERIEHERWLYKNGKKQ